MNRVVSSPVIRKPSLAPLPRRRRTTLTPPLPPLVLNLVRALVVLLVLWSEHLSFRFAASYSCRFDDTPSVKGRVWDGSLAPGTATPAGWTADPRWRDAAQRGDRRGTPFHVLVVADPQLLDMHSYPGRNWALRWLGVRISDAYARKAWSVVTRLSRGKSGGGVDAVVWLGDLLDSAIQTVDSREYASYVHRFHLLFPLPRASTSSFSALSSRGASSSSSFLVPPIPSIIVPGNHDLGLHRSSTSLAAYGRERFAEAFGPTWGVREWNGWEVVWVDSMALLEDEFWEGDGGQYAGMKRWIDELDQGHVTSPRILLTHIPLYRPDGTSCGRAREHSRPIAQGAGLNYQNELDPRASQYLLRTVRPSVVYSGDDHDACVVRHDGVASPLDGVTPVTETTVKAFSMAMGVRRPGYHLLSLYGPLAPSGTPPEEEEDAPLSFTYTQSNCVLPDALGTYLHVYLPLSLSFLLFFLVPKLAVVVRGAVQRRRYARRSAVARANGSTLRPAGGGGFDGARNGHRHKRSLSATLLGGGGGGSARRSGASGSAAAAEEDADAEDVEAQFPGLLGGTAHLDAVGFGLGGGTGEEDEDDELLSDGDGEGGSGLPLAHHHHHHHHPGMRTPGGHVRRVSRVWLWEGSGKAPSPQGSVSLSSASRGGPLSTSRNPFSPSSSSPTLLARLARLPSLALDRLANNTPLRAALRPLYRALRSLWRKAAAPFARLAGGKGWAGQGGQAIAEAVGETGEVAWPAVVAWVAVGVWYAL